MADSSAETRGVTTLVCELAHKCRDALETKSVRNKVRKIVRDTIETQHRLLQSDGEANAKARRAHIAWSRGCGVGDEPLWPYPEHNRGKATKTKDWPFPIEHGIEEYPGCILVFAALNDFAAENPSLFQKMDCSFIPLEPFGNTGGAWFIYGMHWVYAVKDLKDLTDKQEAKLLSAVQSAEVALGVNPDSVRAHQKKLFPLGIPGDLDLRDAILELDAKRGEGKADIQILRDFTGWDDPKIASLQGRIRKARQAGRTTLPPRR